MGVGGVDQKVPEHRMTIGGSPENDDIPRNDGESCPWSPLGAEST